MQLQDQSQEELIDLMIKLASTLKEDDLSNPATFGLVSQLIQIMDPKEDPIPQPIVDELLQIKDKAERFRAAAKVMGIQRPDLMEKLAESLKAAGLLKSDRLESLEKGFFRDMAVGAAMTTAAASAAMAPAPTHHSPVLNPPKVQLHSDLKLIAQIESSGGKNKHHEMTKVGLNAGQTAGGSTGMMPIMAQETISKSPALRKKYGHLLLADHKLITHTLNDNPNMESEIANSHWNRLGKVFGNNGARKAYAWRRGIGAAKEATDQEVADHPYVKKYTALGGK